MAAGLPLALRAKAYRRAFMLARFRRDAKRAILCWGASGATRWMETGFQNKRLAVHE
jgi:hypothetical protein